MACARLLSSKWCERYSLGVEICKHCYLKRFLTLKSLPMYLTKEAWIRRNLPNPLVENYNITLQHRPKIKLRDFSAKKPLTPSFTCLKSDLCYQNGRTSVLFSTCLCRRNRQRLLLSLYNQNYASQTAEEIADAAFFNLFIGFIYALKRRLQIFPTFADVFVKFSPLIDCN